MKLRTLGVVAAGLWLLGAEGCSGPLRDFNRSGGAGGQAGSAGSNSSAGRTAAGSSGRSSSDGGANDSSGAAGEDSGGDSAQGGEPSDEGVGGTGAVSNGGAQTGGTSAGHGGTSAGSGGASSAGKGGTSAGSGGTSAGGGGMGGASGCAVTCASYQFCATNKCLPTYASTRAIPATDQASGSGQVRSAIVLTDKAQGDIVVQLSGELTVSDATASMLTTMSGLGYARYTADGKLAWFRSDETLASSTNVGRESAVALVPPSDFAVNYVKYDPPTGPNAGTYSARLARVNGNTGNLSWEAKYPDTTNPSGGWPFVIPRPVQGDFLTLYPADRYLPGQACRVIDNGSSGSVTCSGSSYALGAVAGADGATAWIWGGPDATASLPLNPLSASTWPFVSNPYQYGGLDAFILGIRGASTTVGPWFSEGDYGPVLQLAVLSGGDLALTAQGNGYMTFNGGQSLLDQTASVLFRLNVTNGQILWLKKLSQTPTAIGAAPGGRIAVLYQPSSSNPSVELFDGTSGARLSTLPLPATSYPVLAAGQTDLFVLGDYSSSVDFDPGAGVDKPSTSRGVYISRYSF